LVRDDGTLLYPVVDGIARLIVDDGIKLPGDLTLSASSGSDGSNGAAQ